MNHGATQNSAPLKKYLQKFGDVKHLVVHDYQGGPLFFDSVRYLLGGSPPRTNVHVWEGGQGRSQTPVDISALRTFTSEWTIKEWRTLGGEMVDERRGWER